MFAMVIFGRQESGGGMSGHRAAGRPAKLLTPQVSFIFLRVVVRDNLAYFLHVYIATDPTTGVILRNYVTRIA